MSEYQVILNYEGPIEFETTEKLLQKVKADLEAHDIKKVLKKRVYNIMVECVENMLRHKAGDPGTDVHPYIKVEKGNDKYMVTAGNLISNSEVNLLKEKLEMVAKSDKAELQKMYEDQINKDVVPEKNGAGLGIITIALKSNNRIAHDFYPVNKLLSVFELCVTIPVENIKKI